jgi:hypothetical protein
MPKTMAAIKIAGDGKHDVGHVYPFTQVIYRYLSPIGTGD